MEAHYKSHDTKMRKFVLHVSKTKNSTSEVSDPKYFPTYREAFTQLLHELTYWLSPFRNGDDPWPVVKAEEWDDVSDNFEDSIIAWQVWDEDARHNILLTIYKEWH